MAYGLQPDAGDLNPRQSAGSVTDRGLPAGSTKQHLHFSKAVNVVCLQHQSVPH